MCSNDFSWVQARHCRASLFEINLGKFRFSDVLTFARLTSLCELSTVFVGHMLGRLTSLGEPLTIVVVSVFDEDMVFRYDDFVWCLTTVRQRGCVLFRDILVSRRSRLRSTHLFRWAVDDFRLSYNVLVFDGLTAFGELSTIFVSLKLSVC